jgi:inorganic pyrophosphatase
MLYVVDEMGQDNKVIAVDASDDSLNDINDIDEIDPRLMQSIEYLLEHNKDGMEGRWTKVSSKTGKKAAIDEIMSASALE